MQKYCFITYPPNVFATFFYLFFAFPDCQGVMNVLFLPSFGFTFLRSFGLTQKNQICSTPSPLGRSFLSLAFRSSLLFFFLSSYFSPFNSQFSILHSQLTKSRRVFIISRRLFNKRRRLFSISCLPFLNQINGNRFRSSADLISIPV